MDGLSKASSINLNNVTSGGLGILDLDQDALLAILSFCGISGVSSASQVSHMSLLNYGLVRLTYTIRHVNIFIPLLSRDTYGYPSFWTYSRGCFWTCHLVRIYVNFQHPKSSLWLNIRCLVLIRGHLHTLSIAPTLVIIL